MAVLGLRFCARAFSSCGERGPSSSRCTGLSLSRPLLLRSTSSRRAGSVVVAHGPSCSTARGIFPDQGLSPCPLHWQAESQPLSHQGSPRPWLFNVETISVFLIENYICYNVCCRKLCLLNVVNCICNICLVLFLINLIPMSLLI